MRKLITCVIFIVTLGVVAFAATGAGADTVDTFSWGTPGQTTVTVGSFAPDQWAPAGTYAINPSEQLVLIGQVVNGGLYDGYNVNGTVAAIVDGIILAPGSFNVGLLPTGAILAVIPPFDFGTYTHGESFATVGM